MTYTAEQLDGLNNTELRSLCYQNGQSKNLSSWTPRESLVKYLLTGEPLETDKIDVVRLHHSSALINKWAHYKHCLTCDANCFKHHDVQVLECQINNPALQHVLIANIYKESHEEIHS